MKCDLCSGDGIVRNVTAALSGNDACPRCHGSGLEPRGHDGQFDKPENGYKIVSIWGCVVIHGPDDKAVDWDAVLAMLNEAPSATLPNLDGQDFYELCQQYRHARIDAVDQFNAIIKYIKTGELPWPSYEDKTPYVGVLPPK